MKFHIPDDLTVIIPLYNKSETIERALRSVLNQIELPKEILVVDDGSEDDSLLRVKKLQAENRILKIIEQENKGVSAARNRGVKESTTEFISFLDADDEWLPEHTRNLKNVINKNPEAGFFCVPYIIDAPEGKLKPHVDLPNHFNGIIKNFIQTYSNGYGLIHSSSVCFRRIFFLKTGGFPAGVKSGEDIYLWLRSGLEGTGAAVNERSVILHKDEIGSVERRKKYIPYHIAYFTGRVDDYPEEQAGEIRQFLTKNILLLWAASKIENNRWQRNVLRSYLYKLNKIQWLLLLFSELIPAGLFAMIRKRRIRKRLKN